MEESSASNVSPVFLPRTSSRGNILTAFALALGAVMGSLATMLFSSNDFRSGDHRYLRTSTSLERMERILDDEPEICSIECCKQYEDTFCPTENAWIAAIPFWLQIVLVGVFLCFSALFSGLTLGLMSLDKTGLEIVMSGDDPKAAEYAKVIYPVRENGNLLLCTLLLGNVSVNAILSIFMADFAGGIIGFVTSTFLIVIFGEILPQAFVSLARVLLVRV
jgi:hypothetical protein